MLFALSRRFLSFPFFYSVLYSRSTFAPEWLHIDRAREGEREPWMNSAKWYYTNFVDTRSFDQPHSLLFLGGRASLSVTVVYAVSMTLKH